jgi:hypothetical protein
MNTCCLIWSALGALQVDGEMRCLLSNLKELVAAEAAAKAGKKARNGSGKKGGKGKRGAGGKKDKGGAPQGGKKGKKKKDPTVRNSEIGCCSMLRLPLLYIRGASPCHTDTHNVACQFQQESIKACHAQHQHSWPAASQATCRAGLCCFTLA